MTNEELDRLQRISDSATIGPWGISGAFMQFIDSDPESDRNDTIICEMWNRNALHDLSDQGMSDLAFIMTARTALPELIAEVRRLTALAEAAENDMEDMADRDADPCNYCSRKVSCRNPSSCPAGQYSRFKWRGPAHDDNA